MFGCAIDSKEIIESVPVTNNIPTKSNEINSLFDKKMAINKSCNISSKSEVDDF